MGWHAQYFSHAEILTDLIFLLFLFKSKQNTASKGTKVQIYLLSLIWSPRNKIKHKYDAMFVFYVTAAFSEV